MAARTRCLDHDLEGDLVETHLIEHGRSGRPYRVKRLLRCPLGTCARTWETREYPPSDKQRRLWSWLKTQPGVLVVVSASALGYRPLPPPPADLTPPARLPARLFVEFCQRRKPTLAEQEAFLDMLRRARTSRKAPRARKAPGRLDVREPRPQGP